MSEDGTTSRKCPDCHETIERVHAFYDRAWNKLAILVGVVGVALPGAIGVLQYVNFEAYKDQFEKQQAHLLTTAARDSERVKSELIAAEARLDAKLATFEKVADNSLASLQVKMDEVDNRITATISSLGKVLPKYSEEVQSSIDTAKAHSFVNEAELNWIQGRHERVVEILFNALERMSWPKSGLDANAQGRNTALILKRLSRSLSKLREPDIDKIKNNLAENKLDLGQILVRVYDSELDDESLAILRQIEHLFHVRRTNNDGGAGGEK